MDSLKKTSQDVAKRGKIVSQMVVGSTRTSQQHHKSITTGIAKKQVPARSLRFTIGVALAVLLGRYVTISELMY
jgi:hypothetical protein